MKQKLCVTQDGEGCRYCILTDKQTVLRCRMDRWSIGKGYVKLSQNDYKLIGYRKLIMPRYRAYFEVAGICGDYDDA